MGAMPVNRCSKEALRSSLQIANFLCSRAYLQQGAVGGLRAGPGRIALLVFVGHAGPSRYPLRVATYAQLSH